MRIFSSQPKKIILINANVLTMDNLSRTAGWLALSGGRIQALGKQVDLNLTGFRDFAVIDCHGKTVLPGFNDAHCHLRAFAESRVTLDLRPSPTLESLADLKNAIKSHGEKKAKGSWLRGRGYNEFYLFEKRHPTRWDLDEIAPEHPVKLTHRSGHAHVLNTLALKLVGISRQTEDPPGGLIDRDMNTGEPTGLLYEMGEFLSKRIPPLDYKELLRGIELANRELLSLGITSLQDASHSNDLERLKEMLSWKEEGLFNPRINFMLSPSGLEQLQAQGFSSSISENQLRLNCVKLIIDETTGHLSPSQDELNNTVLTVHERGFQVAIHAVEESAVESACSAIEYALRRFPRSDHRHRIEHCSVCPPALLKRLASLGITVVTQPSFLFYNGDRYLQTVPDHLLEHIYPIGSLLRAGIPVAGSSDFPIAQPNPLIGIYSAVCRKAETGKTIGEGEKISSLDALAMYTVHAARARFEESLQGSITAGKLADLVVLNGNPSVAPPDEIRDMEVKMTILSGEMVWEKRC
jgi:predicted amidohydrolase YtcJ